MADGGGEMERPPIPGGRGGRKARPTPRGRQADPAALEEVRALLGDRPRGRDLLIEHLHLIQDARGHISAAHLRALAAELRLSQAEVYEVATFYAHFDLVKEGAMPPPATTIRVCDSLTCALKGAEALRGALEAGTDPAEVRVVRAPCMGRCAVAPVAEVGHAHVDHATPEAVLEVVASGVRSPEIPDYAGLDDYRAGGGYGLLARVRSGAVAVEDLIATLSDAGLRGLGGAGFPAGRKWQIVRGFDGPRLMTVNGDEGEPGTFKDRYWLERDPHRFLEGMLIAAHAVAAERVYIYMRDEYPAVLAILAREIAALEAAGLTAPGFVEVRRGAGAYICGEESAMLESIEGKRGLPRHKPPYIAEVGLFGRPTLNHNVETLFWIRDIVEKGANWFAGQGMNGSKGFRSWSVSGRVREPGVIVAPAGVTVRDLIARAGGMEEGHVFKAYLPGGASGGILPAAMDDVALDFGGRLAELGCFVGSHAVVILSDKDDMREVAINLLKFFEDESCGQCTPCRVGCEKAVRLMERERWDAGLLEELCAAMADASICGLGQAAPNPIRSVLRFFREEVA
ncbi:NAD(P)H-dependent oxidoreductase subunit E [Futiania mangrovi]|nr:NAD(P)H-dependent oxidoreductase subunit E [Futiania mangrovii]